MNKISIVLFILATFFVGCEDKAEEKKIQEAIAFKDEELKKIEYAKKVEREQQETKRVVTKENNETNETLLRQMGITISIDTNKTNKFFEKLTSDIQTAADGVKKDIHEMNITLSNTVGIEYNSTALSVDLNKTKSFFEDLGESVDKFVNEINSAN